MAVELDGPVGLRERRVPVRNLKPDQQKVIELLARIPVSEGGRKEAWATPPAAGAGGACPKPLADAIWEFQLHWRDVKKEFRKIDGVVDPGGNTLRKLNALARADLDGPGGKKPSTIGGISVQQTLPMDKVTVHDVSVPAVAPWGMMAPLFQETVVDSRIHEMLFKVEKDGARFWVGAAVPAGTLDYTRAHLYFHPTVINGGTVHATEGDYREFIGGWSDNIYRYVPMQGGQLAAATSVTLLVPFMTMGSLSMKPTSNLFATRPVETLNALMAAVQRELWGQTKPSPTVREIGVSSFSSGISHLRNFARSMAGTGLIVEVNDFDSPFIKREPKALTRVEGAAAKAFTQVPPPNGRELAGWFYLPDHRWRNVKAYPTTHARIGFLTYFAAIMGSVVRSG
jgi:hypothetical protein